MDTIRGHLKGQGALKHIEVPRSIPGLTTKRLLVMSFIDGVQARARPRSRQFSSCYSAARPRGSHVGLMHTTVPPYLSVALT